METSENELGLVKRYTNEKAGSIGPAIAGEGTKDKGGFSCEK